VASDGPGLALAEIDLELVARVRRAIPVRLHRRL
jgi:predicted amidohydrolase